MLAPNFRKIGWKQSSFGDPILTPSNKSDVLWSPLLAADGPFKRQVGSRKILAASLLSHICGLLRQLTLAVVSGRGLTLLSLTLPCREGLVLGSLPLLLLSTSRVLTASEWHLLDISVLYPCNYCIRYKSICGWTFMPVSILLHIFRDSISLHSGARYFTPMMFVGIVTVISSEGVGG